MGIKKGFRRSDLLKEHMLKTMSLSVKINNGFPPNRCVAIA